MQHTYTPQFFDLKKSTEQKAFEDLIQNNPSIRVADTIKSQLAELVKCLNPSKQFSKDQLETLAEEHIAKQGVEPKQYGIWVYYPWKNSMVHLLGEDEFVFMRTARNVYKITREEQNLLCTKKAGIIGLSVGHAIAMTLATERVVGELRLADFDTLELSNMNRIRTSLDNIGLPKVVIAAREIAEIDPFIKVICYADGITPFNIDEFFTENTPQGKLDMLIEECDGIDMKVYSRIKAKEYGVPVVMATSDGGIIDVERYDLDKNLPLMHGNIPDMPIEQLMNLTNEQKLPILIKMLGLDLITQRMKASGLEVGTSLTTWPQLASSVFYDGAVVCDITRRIFLKEFNSSGRYQVEIDKLIADKPVKDTSVIRPLNGKHKKRTHKELKALLETQCANILESFSPEFSNDLATQLVEAASLAPSPGNNQPWKWLLLQNKLFVFFDETRVGKHSDYDGIMAQVAIGAAIENVKIMATSLNKNITFVEAEDKCENLKGYFSLGNSTTNKTISPGLATYIPLRCTNRKQSERELLNSESIKKLRTAAESLGPIKFHYTDKSEEIDQLGLIAGQMDRLRLFHENCHTELFREICFTPSEAEKRREGLDMTLFDIEQKDILGLQIASDWKVIDTLKHWNLGKAFTQMSSNSIKTASCICTLSVPKMTSENFTSCGQAFQRLWLTATSENIALFPITITTSFLARLRSGNLEGFDQSMKNMLQDMYEKFSTIFPYSSDTEHVVMFRLSKAEKPEKKSLRLPLQDIFASYDEKVIAGSERRSLPW